MRYKYYSSSSSSSSPSSNIFKTPLLNMMKLSSFSVLIIIALLFTSAAIAISPTTAPVSDSSRFGCDNKCEVRCSRSGWKDRCLKYCGICCGKCNGCVPSGPYASKAQCPCYRDMKNPKGRDKCP